MIIGNRNQARERHIAAVLRQKLSTIFGNYELEAGAGIIRSFGPVSINYSHLAGQIEAALEEAEAPAVAA